MYGRLNIQMKVIYTVTAGKLQNGDGKNMMNRRWGLGLKLLGLRSLSFLPQPQAAFGYTEHTSFQ